MGLCRCCLFVIVAKDYNEYAYFFHFLYTWELWLDLQKLILLRKFNFFVTQTLSTSIHYTFLLVLFPSPLVICTSGLGLDGVLVSRSSFIGLESINHQVMSPVRPIKKSLFHLFTFLWHPLSSIQHSATLLFAWC